MSRLLTATALSLTMMLGAPALVLAQDTMKKETMEDGKTMKEETTMTKEDGMAKEEGMKGEMKGEMKDGEAMKDDGMKDEGMKKN